MFDIPYVLNIHKNASLHDNCHVYLPEGIKYEEQLYEYATEW